MKGISSESSDLTVIPSQDILEKIANGEPVDYDSVLIRGDLDLGNLSWMLEQSSDQEPENGELLPPNHFLVIISAIRITNSRIEGPLEFERAIFAEDLEFNGTEFMQHVSFAGSHLEGYASFNEAKFDEYADFSESRFGEYADFEGVQFCGDAHFVDAQFNKDSHFRGASFIGDAYFSGSHFDKYADFSESLFTGYASFRISQFAGYAYFSESKFSGDTSFNGVQFHKDASFMGTPFCEDASFSRAQFAGYATFMNSKFEEFADFSDVQFAKDAYFTEVKFESLKLPWSSIKDHIVCDGATYLSLVKIYSDLEWFKDADDCYYQYRSKSQDGKSWSDRSKYLDIIADLTCGYGIRPARTVFLSMGLIFVFAGMFWISGAHASLNDAIYYSFLAFFSDASGPGAVGIFKYIFVSERLMGWLLMSLFLVTLGKVMIR
ncbi:MAG TPA: pentapeptide repeat-containing protein [Methanotrichaceae archaeon]|nr:pentapeptide repeat-containing protein [Methanotrichaceae archaeon]